jgi:auxin-responsive protein IAA
MNSEGENHLVGWPPIKSWRKKELHDHELPEHRRIDRINQANENQSRRSKPLYVKVNMEGVSIGRQINLRLYNSYQTLKDSLISMFVKCKCLVIYSYFIVPLLFSFWYI